MSSRREEMIRQMRREHVFKLWVEGKTYKEIGIIVGKFDAPGPIKGERVRQMLLQACQEKGFYTPHNIKGLKERVLAHINLEALAQKADAKFKELHKEQLRNLENVQSRIHTEEIITWSNGEICNAEQFVRCELPPKSINSCPCGSRLAFRQCHGSLV